MMLAYWNALRAGDQVLVHDASTLGAPLHPGRIAVVDAKQLPHRIGVRAVDVDVSGSAISWPSRLRVHLSPLDPFDPCLWCAITPPAAIAIS